jgi:hypothetical protein
VVREQFYGNVCTGVTRASLNINLILGLGKQNCPLKPFTSPRKSSSMLADKLPAKIGDKESYLKVVCSWGDMFDSKSNGTTFFYFLSFLTK